MKMMNICYGSSLEQTQLTHKPKTHLFGINPVQAVLQVSEGRVGLHEPALRDYLSLRLGEVFADLVPGPSHQWVQQLAVQAAPQTGHLGLQVRHPENSSTHSKL